MSAHHCHARGCKTSVPPEMLMCIVHWRMVPAHLRQAVWKHYRQGQCDDKKPSREWLQAADAAIAYVAARESSPRNLKPPDPEHPNVPGTFTTHRITSNSRGPGQQGIAVTIGIVEVIPCQRCGLARKNLGGPHAPRLMDGVGLVDCVGEPINRAGATHA